MEKDKTKEELLEEKDKVDDENCQHSVKSRAIVKYSTVNTPAHYAQLKCNTDLKPPPSNWLFTSTKNYGLHHPVYKSNGFTSFRLAHMYSDCIGEVDVVSDAENIKKLLKIPYNKAPVSMMVHRIENTLLIDEFDIHKHLLNQAENDWQWLRKFFFENVFQSLPRNNFYISDKLTRSTLQQKSLVSKFLHYSFGENDQNNTQDDLTPLINLTESSSPEQHLICASGPILPEPEPDEGLPDSASDCKFIRNVVWSFEDIQMLLGTDMPIFGGTTHPCISLRLRDIEKPISVLTGIDYWLDNLMSNVPEVVMCYHLDGIVQKYELIKTEDLPHQTDAKFSPELIKDVAQNILSFLKSNATKAGHTYWLFKGRNDDVVKLYDLSSLCSDSLVDNKEQNPFTVPVGLLFYRVARNMKQSKEQTQPSTIRMLLKNCLSLLPKEKYPQIVTSAHYMLSDIYIPFGTDPSSPQLLDDNSSCEDQSHEDEEDDHSKTQVPVKSLCIANYITDRETKYHPPPLAGSITERCMSCLSHVSQGLDCLQYFSKVQNKKSEMREEPKMAKSSEPIPMPYSKLPDQSKDTDTSTSVLSDDSSLSGKKKESANALLCRPKGHPISTWQSPDKMDKESWKTYLEDLLVNKASLAYRTLAEQHFSSGSFGLSLKCISLYLDLCKVGPMEIFNANHISSMLKKAGDCCFHIAKSWQKVDTYIAETNENLPNLATFFKYNHKDKYHNSDLLDISAEITSIREMILLSKSCYLKAVKMQDHEDLDLQTRIGNIYNEMGTIYINQAYELYQTAQQTSGNMDEVDKILKKAEEELRCGMKIFDKLSDSKNYSLLLSNIGKLYRLRALEHFNSVNLYRENIQKAEDSYLEALKVLGSRKEHPEIWDTVNWELSSFLFQQASCVQESHMVKKTLDEVNREVIDLCNKCLKYCDLTTNEHRLLLYQYRAARLHHMLASIFHRQYRTVDDDDNKRKMVLKLCQNHLVKASNLFQAAESYTDVLMVYLERISLYEFQAREVNSYNAKLKLYQSALALFCEMKPVLTELNPCFKTDSNNEPDPQSEDDSLEEKKFLTLEKILCSIFKDIIFISLKSKSGSPSLVAYKEAYGLLLRRTASATPVIPSLLNVIDIISSHTGVMSPDSKTKK